MDFAILQNSNTRETWVYEKHIGWVKHDEEDYEAWARNVRTIRKYPDAFIKTLGLPNSLE